MAVVTAAQLAALMKSKIDTIDFTTNAIENDDLLLRMSEALVVSFSDNNIFADPASNGGVGSSTISLINPIPTLAWDLEPSGTYSAESTGFPASAKFIINTSGGWSASGYGSDSSPSSNGRWRPTTDTNTVSYEIRITHTGADAVAVGGADIDGIWTNLTTNMGISITDNSEVLKTSDVTVEVRVKNAPSNTTTEASFTIEAIGEEFSLE